MDIPYADREDDDIVSCDECRRKIDVAEVREAQGIFTTADALCVGCAYARADQVGSDDCD